MKKLILLSSLMLMFAEGCTRSDLKRDQQREPGQERSQEIPNKDVNFTPANN